jgi:hypothetical protein
MPVLNIPQVKVSVQNDCVINVCPKPFGQTSVGQMVFVQKSWHHIERGCYQFKEATHWYLSFDEWSPLCWSRLCSNGGRCFKLRLHVRFCRPIVQSGAIWTVMTVQNVQHCDFKNIYFIISILKMSCNVKSHY